MLVPQKDFGPCHKSKQLQLEPRFNTLNKELNNTNFDRGNEMNIKISTHKHDNFRSILKHLDKSGVMEEWIIVND